MLRLFFAASLISLVPIQESHADGCHQAAIKVVDARFGEVLGQRVYRDPNTPALPIPATLNDATTLVVAGGAMFLHKGPRVGVIDGFKGVGQFEARVIAHEMYQNAYARCAHVPKMH